MAESAGEFGLIAPPAQQIAGYRARHKELSPLNTTIAVIATDAAMSPAACRRVAVAAQDGLARSIRPVHTPMDGDTVFVLATGAVAVEPDPDTPVAMLPETALTTAVGIAAADCLARAVLAGVLAAESVAGIPTYREVLPGA
jgi:L-aminopeptidase/D-esterase-like protein